MTRDEFIKKWGFDHKWGTEGEYLSDLDELLKEEWERGKFDAHNNLVHAMNNANLIKIGGITFKQVKPTEPMTAHDFLEKRKESHIILRIREVYVLTPRELNDLMEEYAALKIEEEQP